MIKLSFEFDYSSYVRNIKESDLILDEIEDTWIYRFYNSMYDFEVSGDVEDGTITDNNLEVSVSLNGDKIGEGYFASINL